MRTLWQDVCYGFRTLTRNPGFTTVAIVTLALGIGANTAIFSVIDAVLIKSLPVRDPDQLVILTAGGGAGGHGQSSFSYPVFRELRDRNQVFAGMFACKGDFLNLSANGQTERASAQLVSGNYFSVLGVKPYLGRFFSEEDDRTPGGHPVTILGYGFWTRGFGRDPALLGKAVLLNGHPFTVIGISPPGFFGVEVGSSPDLWVPMMMQPTLSQGGKQLQLWNRFWLRIMARLKPHVTEQQAQAVVAGLCEQIYQEAPGIKPALREFLGKQQIQLHLANQGMPGLRRQLQQPLFILMGVVAFVLLITCANVASLLLARATARANEIAVRQALGASRARLMRQFLTESILLSLLGGVLGLLVALGATDLLLRFLSQVELRLELHPDLRVLAFTMGVAAVTGVLFGLAPAFQAARSSATPAIRSQTRVLGGGRTRFVLRKVLVVTQVALTLLLLVAAGLLVRTLQNLRGVDLGFRADKVLLASTNPGLNGYNSNQVAAFYAQLLDRIKSLPGVQSASLADAPLLGGAWIDGLSVEGFEPAPGQDMSTTLKQVEPEFFATMGIAILRGRDFATQDGPGSQKVAIVNETLARDFFGKENPVGRHIGIGDKLGWEIVGIIRDTKYRDVREEPPRTVYLPFAQAEAPDAERTLHIRTAGNPKNLVGALRREVHGLDKDLPVYDVRTFTELVEKTISKERLIATLSGLFGLLALLLASIGLYGIMAYAVVRRTREIGVRMALGATTRRVAGPILREALLLALTGVAVGLPVAFGMCRLIRSQFYGIAPHDPLTLTAVVALLVAVTVIAAWLPARRAARIDPMVALRCE